MEASYVRPRPTSQRQQQADRPTTLTSTHNKHIHAYTMAGELPNDLPLSQHFPPPPTTSTSEPSIT
eukprot:9044507-Pyramimonas_sp.AAC.1